MANTSSYKKLFSNTIIFAIGSFSSKILVLLLVPIYTNYLTPEQVGLNDVIVLVANFLLPIFTLTISEAALRFGMDKAFDKRKVFSIANIVIIFGLAVLSFILLCPAVKIDRLFSIVDDKLNIYTPLLFIYVCTSALKTLYSTFTRAIGKSKLFAFNGILTTFCTLMFTILFIMIFKIGITGYLLATILSDGISVIFLTFSAKLWKYFYFGRFDCTLLRYMLVYCLPLIPAQVMWLITNASDSILVTTFMNPDSNGILNAAYKIPNIVSTVYLMFGQAWSMSAIEENNSEERSKFYTNVFDLNQSLMYVLAAGILLLVEPVTKIWIGKDFQDCLNYSPILIYATIFTCFTTFMASAYVATKKTVRSMVTSLIAGVINIVINIMFIPTIGIIAAALSTFASYFIVFIIRAVDVKKLIGLKLNVFKIVTNCLALFGMLMLCYVETKLKYIMDFGCFLLIIGMNLDSIIKMANAVIPAKIKAKLPFYKYSDLQK